jgi:predicted GNAT family N-acyltransferase
MTSSDPAPAGHTDEHTDPTAASATDRDRRSPATTPTDVACKRVESLNELIDAIRVRVDVFVLEQLCPPGWDPADIDKEAEHYIALLDGTIVATARLREDQPGSMKIECMAVRATYRRLGVGASLTEYLVDVAAERSCHRLWMQAQSHAQRVYERCGFHRLSADEYDLYGLGIPHVTMEYSKDLQTHAKHQSH